MEAKHIKIYLKAEKCYEFLNEVQQIFNEILTSSDSFSQAKYYRARSLLKEGEKYFQELLKIAKKLMGPAPAYVVPDYEKWRQEFLLKEKLLITSSESEEVLNELLEDDHLKKWLSPEKIKELFNKHYLSQQQGKRKLANLKMRILIDFLEDLLENCQELKNKAMARQTNLLSS
jgi:hypothetical protein